MKAIILAAYTRSLLTFRLPLMRALQSKGWEVLAVGPGDESQWRPKFEAQGVAFRSIPLNRNGLNPLSDLRACRAMKELFLQEKPDLLFCSQAKAVVYGVPAARGAKVPHVYSLVSGLGSVFRGGGLKNAIVRSILKIQYRVALDFSDGVFFQNGDDRDVFLNLHLVAPEKVHMIPGSGVDIQRFKPMPLPKTPTFLMVARLLRDKGVQEYLDAARMLKTAHPEARFLLVGPYDSNPTAIQPKDLQPYVDEGTIEYLGEMEDVRPAHAQASVFVLPSYHEGTPMSVLEALACGRAVVTTTAPGCRETVRDQLNGFLVPVKDTQALADAMETFIRIPGLAEDMGGRGRILAENLFASEIVNQKLFDVMKI